MTGDRSTRTRAGRRRGVDVRTPGRRAEGADGAFSRDRPSSRMMGGIGLTGLLGPVRWGRSMTRPTTMITMTATMPR